MANQYSIRISNKEIQRQRLVDRDLARQQIQLVKERPDEFLKALFSDVARKPERLTIRKCAGPIRYLMLLCLVGVPKDRLNASDEQTGEMHRDETDEVKWQRIATESLAQGLWGHLLETAEINTSGKEEAQRLLRRMSATIFPGDPRIPQALKFLGGYDLPKSYHDPFVPHSVSMQSSQRTPPHIVDDLSERIYVANCVLERCELAGRSARIAAALNDAKIGRRESLKRDGWTYADVNERIKDYKKKLRSEIRATTHRENGVLVEKTLEQQEDRRVYLWVSRYFPVASLKTTTAAGHLWFAVEELLQRPKPNTSSAVAHATNAVECVLGELTGKSLTLRKYLDQYPHLVHPALKRALEGVYGYVSDQDARYRKEGAEPTREDAEFAVSVCAAVCTLLTRQNVPDH
jgi:hypothetical protein